MNLIQQIQANIAKSKAKEIREKEKAEKNEDIDLLAFKLKLKEFYELVKELHLEPFSYNTIHYFGGYDVASPNYNTNKVKIHVTKNERKVSIRLCGWIFTYGGIYVTKSIDSDFLELWVSGLTDKNRSKFPDRSFANSKQAKAEVVNILSNLNQF